MKKTGHIIVITGPMKSGKSEEILRRKKRYEIANKNVLMIKPDIDRRFGESIIKSRDKTESECVAVPAANPEYIFSLIDNNTDVVIIDEAQFFEYYKSCDLKCGMFLCRNCPHNFPKPTIVEVVQNLSDRGIDVIIAGLDMTSERIPFRCMPELMAIADEVIKLKAVCEFCKEELAIYSYATFNKNSEIVLGSEEDKEYKAVCRSCYLRKTKKST